MDEQLALGEVHVVGLYILVGYIGPEPKGISYPQFHGGFWSNRTCVKLCFVCAQQKLVCGKA
jgi:hypothetical protein